MPIQTKITDGHTKILPCDKNWNIEWSKHCKCLKELILRQKWIRKDLPKFKFLTPNCNTIFDVLKVKVYGQSWFNSIEETERDWNCPKCNCKQNSCFVLSFYAKSTSKSQNFEKKHTHFFRIWRQPRKVQSGWWSRVDQTTVFSVDCCLPFSSRHSRQHHSVVCIKLYAAE